MFKAALKEFGWMLLNLTMSILAQNPSSLAEGGPESLLS